MRKIFAILLVLCLIFTSTTFAEDIKLDDETLIKTESLDKWTVMYYIAGEVKNMDTWADPLIENLTNIKSTPDLNIVVLNDGFCSGDLELLYISSTGTKVDISDDLGWPDEIDTSDLNTLEFFCKQIMTIYPAEHYGLIPIASGGTGWQLFCLHDAHDGEVGVSIPAFGNTLKNIYEDTGSKIDVIYTSCAMNMVEVAYEFSPYVNYIVGTETCLAKQHLVKRFYDAVWDLKNDTTMNPEEFASKTAERLDPLTYYYHESYYDELPILNRILLKLPFKALHPVEYNDSVAIVNLSNIDELVQSLDDLSQFLILNDFDCEIKHSVGHAWGDSKKLGKCLPRNKILRKIHRNWQFEATASNRFIDLYHFVYLLKENTDNFYLKFLCSKVMDDFNNAISAMKKVEDDDQYGLSIYFPPNKYNYNKYPVLNILPAKYEELKFSQDTSWDEFLKTYFNIQ